MFYKCEPAPSRAEAPSADDGRERAALIAALRDLGAPVDDDTLDAVLEGLEAWGALLDGLPEEEQEFVMDAARELAPEIMAFAEAAEPAPDRSEEPFLEDVWRRGDVESALECMGAPGRS